MTAIQTMSALAQPTRLVAFQILVDALPGGLASSELADALGIARNLMSPHLAIMSRAGLVSSTKSGRTVTYRARVDTVKRLASYLDHSADRGAARVTEPHKSQ